MFKTLTAGVTALSLSLAAPVRAAEVDNVTNFVAGLAAVALIGAAIKSGTKDSWTEPVLEHGGSLGDAVVNNAPLLRTQPAPAQRIAPSRLPSECLISVAGRHGMREVYGERCMERNFSRANRLPEACEVRVRGVRQERSGYAPDCLRQFGYLEEWRGYRDDYDDDHGERHGQARGHQIGRGHFIGRGRGHDHHDHD